MTKNKSITISGEDLCVCGHPRVNHHKDGFDRIVCDHSKDYSDGTYGFDCKCLKFKLQEAKE